MSAERNSFGLRLEEVIMAIVRKMSYIFMNISVAISKIARLVY